ncbi:MAG: DUF86 domain-containing protein, partial [Candidatus Hodarchaeota archaeon]
MKKFRNNRRSSEKYTRGIKIKYEYDWREVAGLRDILTHRYFGISLQIVWDIIQNELIELEKVICQIISDIIEKND